MNSNKSVLFEPNNSIWKVYLDGNFTNLHRKIPGNPGQLERIFTFEKDMSKWEHNFFAAAYFILGVAAIVGNSLVITAFLKQPVLFTRQSVVLFSLAVANFLNGWFYVSLTVQLISQVNFHLISDQDSSKGHERNVYGVLINTLQIFPAHCAGVHTLLIIFDRHVAITHPFKYRMQFNRRKAVWVIVGSWIFTGVTTTAPLIAIIVMFLSGNNLLVYRIRLINPLYQGGLGFLLYAFIVVSLIVLCTLMLLNYRQYNRELCRGRITLDPVTAVPDTFDRVIKINLVIVTYFTVSYLPYIICRISMAINGNNIAFYKGSFYSGLLLATNSSINIILYALISRKFKEALQAVLKCKKVRRSSVGNSRQSFALSPRLSNKPEEV